MKRFVLLFSVLLAGSAAQGLLPPDAPYRQKEILRYRARKTAESEQRKEQHGRQMIAMDQKIREAMSRSPWVSVPGEAGKSAQRAYPAAARKKGLRTRVIYRWIFSVTALLLIGCCVLWVRGATKPDER